MYPTKLINTATVWLTSNDLSGDATAVATNPTRIIHNAGMAWRNELIEALVARRLGGGL